MSEQERDKLRRKKVALVHRMAKEGNPIALSYSFRLLNRDPDHQDEVLAEIASMLDKVKVAVRKIHGAMQERIVRNTGMTLGDFLWLRDYESSRRADGLAPEEE